MIKKAIPAALMSASLMVSAAVVAATDYVIDTKGMHAFIEFRIKHLGYSWLLGRFKRFEGEFSYDEKHPGKNRVEVTIDVSSLDSRCQPWRAKRRLVDPSSREAALLTRRAHSARGEAK